MAFTAQMIGSRKNLYPECSIATEMNGHATGGETPGGQRRNVLVYKLLLQKMVLKLYNCIQIILQIQKRNFTYLN